MSQVRKLTKDGNEITDLSIINDEQKQFYKNLLYSKKISMTEEQCMDYVSEVGTPSLAKEEAEICEGKHECLTALTLFQPWGGGGWNPPPSRFFPRHRHKNQPIDSKLSDF